MKEDFDLELEKIVNKIKEKNYKRVLIQLPFGLKPKALEIAKYIKENTEAEVYIWGGSAYGACDIPIGVSKFGIDLLVHFGHAMFRADEIHRY